MLWIILAVIPIILFYVWEASIFKYWEKRNVYYEKPIPILGNFLKVFFRQQQLGYLLKDIYDKLDNNVPYFGMFFFQRPVLVVKSPELIKTVLIKDFSSFINRVGYVNQKIDPLSSNTLFALKNDVWKTLRHKLAPVFTSGKMKMMLPLMKEVTNQLEEVLEENDNNEVDVRDLMKKYTIDTISTCAFGINAQSIKNENSEIKEMADKLTDQSGFVRSFSAFSWLFCPLFVVLFRLTFIDRESAEFLTEVFKKSAEERKAKKIVRNDLIDLLFKIRAEEKQDDLFQLNELRLSAQALVFFNAGAEGARTMLTFCLYELALNPEIQDQLRKEIKENLDSNGTLSYETLFGLEYLDLVSKETLRKYPFVQFLSRIAEREYEFPSGMKIDAGVQVIIPMLALHYDEQYYPNPTKFDPERFRGDKMKELQQVYLPFGDGPRKCIGERFAIMSVKIALVMFLKNFKVTVGERTEVPMKLVKAAFFLTPLNSKVYLKVVKDKQ